MAYEALAAEYDPLTQDVDYEELADYLTELLTARGAKDGLLLDLACGTGTLSCILAERGYEVIGADVSPEMLTLAQSKAYSVREGTVPPVFVMQDMRTLDLFGTVGAAVCTLDGINHLLDEDELRETLHRLWLFIEPGGTLIFDINTPYKLRDMDGQAFLDEVEDTFCAWSVAETDEEDIFEFCIDIFTKSGKLWRRSSESFCERAWEIDFLKNELAAAGFGKIEVFGDRTGELPSDDEYRVFFVAERSK